MSLTIGIVMQCMLTTTNVPVALQTNTAFTGTCSGFYEDKVSHDVVGAWSMEMRFAPQDNGERLSAIRLRGGAVMPGAEGKGDYAEFMAELEKETVRFAAREVLRQQQPHLTSSFSGPGI